ncbi:uncharacterized protein BX663DRAFT_524787 [Cokeromyces recurvatus]|uniref:uncharacterized protein n=1 Tax=Cokeromyces recurvatus TaxID=90255 RepID=UPI00221EEE8A|nr:uncharacterized protein BX663DRAFT_524787 [Cokeromyces recurvatus]KAI7898458.1 hypothetical protein BX663DRAFT_524787 [Cokeromyces recurvatus]
MHQYFQVQQKDLQKHNNLQKQIQQQHIQRQHQIQFQQQNAALIQRMQQFPIATSQPIFGHPTIVNSVPQQTSQAINYTRPPQSPQSTVQFNPQPSSQSSQPQSHQSSPQFDPQHLQSQQQQQQQQAYWLPTNGTIHNTAIFNPVTPPTSSNPPTPTSTTFNTTVSPPPSSSIIISPIIGTSFVNSPNKILPNSYASNTTTTTTTTTVSASASSIIIPTVIETSPAPAPIPIPIPVPIPKLLPSKNEISYLPGGDFAHFSFMTGYAIQPFKLIHDEEFQRKQFHINSETYRLLYKNTDLKINKTDTVLPRTYIVNAWYSNTSERKCDWPASVRVELNGRELHLQKRQKHTSPNGQVTYIGKDLPFDLTKLIKVGENTLGLHQFGCACSFRFSVQIHTRFSENWILHHVHNTLISVKDSETMIDNLLGNNQTNDDDDIMVIQESVKLRLKCPITMKRMKQPVRGQNCKHVDCFDLEGYLIVNKTRNPVWQCPHCSTVVGPKSLARDALTEKLLKELPKNVVEIEYTQDHTQYKMTQLDDLDSDDNEQTIKKSTADINVIDLISDDEEEEVQDLTSKRPRLS